MPLNFPEVDEVPLLKPPLSEVICQIRFPPILKIGSELPVEIQDKLRKTFPKYESVNEISFSEMETTLKSQTTLHNFTSTDGNSRATLSINFLALTEKAYSSWDDFKVKLNMLTEAAFEVYSPSPPTRIGLRYVNKLTLEKLGLNEIDELVNLLNDQLTHNVNSEVWGTVEKFQCLIGSLDGTAHMNIRYGLEPEPSVFVDIDYYEQSEGMSFDGLLDRLDNYHNVVYSAFRWCIKEEALDYFGREDR